MPVSPIRLADLPAKIRARLNLPPLPPEPREKPNLDFYEFQRYRQRKDRERQGKLTGAPSVSLVKAIHDLNPDADAKAEVKKAKHEVDDDLKES